MVQLSLYLVRHGQTPCSQQGKICGGRCDSHLSANGAAAARKLATALAPLRFSGIYTSPQQRALQTITPLVTETGQQPIIARQLRELDYGLWDNVIPESLDEAQAEALQAWRQKPAELRPPGGGENGAEVADRVQSLLKALRKEHGHDGEAQPPKLLFISHKCTLRLLLSSLFGNDLNHFRSDWPMPLCSMTIVDFLEQGPRLRLVGAQSHLPEALRGLPGD